LRVCVLQINLVPVLGQEGDDFTTSALWLIYDNADNLADFHRPNLPWTFAVRGLNENSLLSLTNLGDNPDTNTLVVLDAVPFQRAFPGMASLDTLAVFTRASTVVCSAGYRG
jgi:hypothetical protein